MIPLNLIDLDRPAIIYKVTGSTKIKQHLETLGLIHNRVVVVVSNTSGNLIIKCNDTKLAISADLARYIYVLEEK